MPQGTVATVEQSQAFDHTGELEAAVRLLRKRLSAGLPIEQAMSLTEDRIDQAYPAFREAIELWFGMEY